MGVTGAVINLFFPPFGHLVQGRLGAFVVWLVLLLLFAASILVGVGVVLLPVGWVLCVVDAARYREPQPRQFSPFRQ